MLPDKTYYKIGEVAQIADLKTSVLRFWESEFPFLCPEKSSSGQRLYSKQDIETVCQIKQLLYHEKYTIEGVRNKLLPRKKRQAKTTHTPSAVAIDLHDLLLTVRSELQELRACL